MNSYRVQYLIENKSVFRESVEKELAEKSTPTVERLGKVNDQFDLYITVCWSLSKESPAQTKKIISELNSLVGQFHQLIVAANRVSTPCQQASWEMENTENYARSRLALMYLSMNNIKSAKEQLGKFPRKCKTANYVAETKKAIDKAIEATEKQGRYPGILFSIPKQLVEETSKDLCRPSPRKSCG